MNSLQFYITFVVVLGIVLGVALALRQAKAAQVPSTSAALVDVFPVEPAPAHVLKARYAIDKVTSTLRPAVLEEVRKDLGTTLPRGGWDEPDAKDRAGVTWTTPERNNLEGAFNSGASLEQMAAQHGRTEGAINARLVQMGLLTGDSRKGYYHSVTRQRWS